MTDQDWPQAEQFPGFLARALASGPDLAPTGVELHVDRLRVHIAALPGEGPGELAARVAGVVRARLEAAAERGVAW